MEGASTLFQVAEAFSLASCSAPAPPATQRAREAPDLSPANSKVNTAKYWSNTGQILVKYWSTYRFGPREGYKRRRKTTKRRISPAEEFSEFWLRANTKIALSPNLTLDHISREKSLRPASCYHIFLTIQRHVAIGYFRDSGRTYALTHSFCQLRRISDNVTIR